VLAIGLTTIGLGLGNGSAAGIRVCCCERTRDQNAPVQQGV
jgi:hypothetical protein